MRCFVLCAGTAAVLALLAPVPVSAQGKKGGPAVPPATAEDYAALKGMKEISGEFMGLTGTTLTLRIEYPAPPQPGKGNPRPPQNPYRPNNYRQPPRTPQEAARRMAQQQQQAARQVARQVQQAVQQAARQANGGGHMLAKLLELPLAEGVKVRWAQPPTTFDDKGEVKKYSQAELRKMKGDNPNLPGYEGQLEDLLPNQTVQLTLGRAKATNKDDKEAVENRSPVTTILIVQEGTKPDGTGKDRKGM